MEEFWKWIQRAAWLAALVSFARGWISMNDIKLFWDNLNPWQFIFYLSIGIIFITLIRGHYRTEKKLKHLITDVENLKRGELEYIRTKREEIREEIGKREGEILKRKNEIFKRMCTG